MRKQLGLYILLVSRESAIGQQPQEHAPERELYVELAYNVHFISFSCKWKEMSRSLGLGLLCLHIRDIIWHFRAELCCHYCSPMQAAFWQSECPRTFHNDPAFRRSNAKSSRTALEPFIVKQSIKRRVHNSIAHRLLFHSVDSLCVQHSPSYITRNDQDFSSPSAASEHLGVAHHYSCNNIGYADIQPAGFVRRQDILVLSIICGPLYLGNTDLHWLRCGRAQNVEESAVLARDQWKIFRRTKTEEHYDTSLPRSVYYCSDVNSERLLSCQRIRYIQTFRNDCEHLLEQVCNHVSANVLPACHCGFDLCSCHSIKVWKRFRG